MRRLLNWLVLLPLGIILVLFAVANRAFVTLSFDPFSSESPALTFTVPLFIVVVVFLVIGIVVGTLISLARQWRLWRSLHRAEEEAAELKAEIAARERAQAPLPPQYPSLPMAG